MLHRRSVNHSDHPVCRLRSGRVAMAAPVHLLDRILKLTIRQRGPLSISLCRLGQIKRLCRLMQTFASLDLRLIHVCRHLYHWLPRFSRIAHTSRLCRYFQAIQVYVAMLDTRWPKVLTSCAHRRRILGLRLCLRLCLLALCRPTLCIRLASMSQPCVSPYRHTPVSMPWYVQVCRCRRLPRH